MPTENKPLKHVDLPQDGPIRLAVLTELNILMFGRNQQQRRHLSKSGVTCTNCLIDDDKIWKWKSNMNIGTWNVRSLFRSAALNVLHNERSKLDFGAAALQEMRLESGTQTFDNFALFNNGSECKKN